MRESRPYGSVRGALSNERPYRNPECRSVTGMPPPECPECHGDPRDGKVHLVDWIERIPFDETRDYVERVSEILGVYRQRFADDPPAPAPVSARLARE